MTDEGYEEALERIKEAARKKSRKLDISNLGLTTIPPELFKLTKLEELYLNDNRITAIPDSLGRLVNLDTLFFYNNRITAIPDVFNKLANLRHLNLSGNQIATIPESIGALTRLEALFLYDNKIRVIPKALYTLINLHELCLHNNCLKAASNLRRLGNLRMLCLFDNQITSLPKSLGTLENLQEIYLHGNSQLGIPAEVLGPRIGEAGRSVNRENVNDILEYYFRAKATGRPLNEAKLILVGRGAVGKSSLVEKLIHNTFSAGKTKTEGIDIERWEIPIDGEDIRLNVWDFGGQEIMHATHQFFLTERSLYLLVLNGRDGSEEADAEYWLKLIESFGVNSPVIIVLNKISEHAFDLNRNALLKKYQNICDFVRTDCANDIGINELKAIILKETARLDELRVRFPGEWFAVKDRLSTTKRNFLSFAEYREMCAETGVVDKRYQEMLARYLNQLGIVLNYRDDPRLKHTHVLNPHWVTEGIYKILNSKKLEAEQGQINLGDLSSILPDDEYPDATPRFIIELMKKFDLCFSFPGDDCKYLIPELLPKNEPDEAQEFDLKNCLNFQYHYPVLPEGLLPRFITRTYELSEGQPRWRSGVTLIFEGCRALVRADAVDKKVFISIDGDSLASRRRLLAVVRADFERIHGEIKNLGPAEMVPLPGLPDEVVSYADLLVMEEEGVETIYKVVNGQGQNFRVADLLNGVDLSKQQRTRSGEGLKLFFSYAREDDSYRSGLKRHLTILEREGAIQSWSDREIEAGDNWEEEIMEKLNSSDIILLLISSDFIDSDFCYKVEMQRALEREKAGEAKVIPVIIRDCLWEGKAPFSKLQVLPEGAKAVSTWDDKDTAWKSVAEEIDKSANSLKARKLKVIDSEPI